MKTFRELMSEVAQPKAKDEIDFKAKHEIEMIDHPESKEHQHTSEKKGRKRLADYAKGQDMSVYESIKFGGKTFTDYKSFNSDREANRFLEKNDDYGVIGTKGGKVYVAKMDDMGEAKHYDDDDVEENAFMGKAAAAKKSGKDKFKLGDKEFPVTIKKDTAKEILDDDLDESNTDKYMWKDINAALMKAGVPPTTIMRVISALKGKELKEDAIDESNKDIDAIMSISKIKRDAQKTRHGITRKPRESLAAFIARAEKHKAKMQKEEVDLTENFKQGSLTLKDGSKVIVSKQNADLLNQMFNDLNATNRREMMKVAMEDKDGFNEILGFAREAL